MKITEMNDKERKEAIEIGKARRAAKIEKFIMSEGRNLRSYLDDIPDSMKNIWIDSFYGDNSNAKAIKAKCLDCSAFQRDEITFCQVVTCPLFMIRPYQKK